MGNTAPWLSLSGACLLDGPAGRRLLLYDCP